MKGQSTRAPKLTMNDTDEKLINHSPRLGLAEYPDMAADDGGSLSRGGQSFAAHETVFDLGTYNLNDELQTKMMEALDEDVLSLPDPDTTTDSLVSMPDEQVAQLPTPSREACDSPRPVPPATERPHANTSFADTSRDYFAPAGDLTVDSVLTLPDFAAASEIPLPSVSERAIEEHSPTFSPNAGSPAAGAPEWFPESDSPARLESPASFAAPRDTDAQADTNRGTFPSTLEFPETLELSEMPGFPEPLELLKTPELPETDESFPQLLSAAEHTPSAVGGVDASVADESHDALGLPTFDDEPGGMTFATASSIDDLYAAPLATARETVDIPPAFEPGFELDAMPVAPAAFAVPVASAATTQLPSIAGPVRSAASVTSAIGQFDAECRVLDTLIAEIDTEVTPDAFEPQTTTGQFQASEATAARQEHHVIFTLGETAYSLPIDNVLEIARPPVVTPLPSVPDWVEGVANLRGDIISVINLRAFLGIGGEAPISTRETRMLVVRSRYEEVTTGMVVDSVREISYLDAERFDMPTAPVEGQVGQYLRGVHEHGEHLLVLLDPERLMLSPEMRQFELAGGAQ